MPKVNKEKMEIYNKLRNANIVSKDEYDCLTLKQMKKLWDEHEAKNLAAEKEKERVNELAKAEAAKAKAEAKAEKEAKAEAKAAEVKAAHEKAVAEAKAKAADAKAKEEETKKRLIAELEQQAKAKIENEAKAKESLAASLQEKAKEPEIPKPIPQATVAPSMGVVTSMPVWKDKKDCTNCGDAKCRANMEAMSTNVAPNSCQKHRLESAPALIAAVPKPKYKERDTVLYKDRILAQVESFYWFGKTYLYKLTGLSENQTYDSIPEAELSLSNGKIPDPVPIMPVPPKGVQPVVRDCKNCGDAVCSTNQASMWCLVAPNSCVKWMGMRKFQPGMAVKYKGSPMTINTFYMSGRAWVYTLKGADGKITDAVPEAELSQ